MEKKLQEWRNKYGIENWNKGLKYGTCPECSKKGVRAGLPSNEQEYFCKYCGWRGTNPLTTPEGNQ